MKYKRGSKVEVLSKNDVPSSSWRCAEIICGNGHNYTVGYDMPPGAANVAIVERVSRKSIRPSPPPLELIVSSGDVVEVFHNFSWKMATVSKVLGRNYFLVRLLGSSQEFKVGKFDLRIRQSWQDDKWIMVGQGFWNREDPSERSTLKYNKNLCTHVKETVKDDFLSAKNSIDFQDSRVVSSKTLKRGSPYCHSQIELDTGTALKFRVIEKDGRRHRVISANPFLSTAKVEAGTSPGEVLGEKDIYASYNNRTTHFSEVDVEMEKLNGTVGCSHGISLETNDADNATSSVGSCSMNNNYSFKLPCNFSAGPVEDTEGQSSDAESSCRWGYNEENCLLLPKEELKLEIHRLELHAYRCTLEALHASGPLSWERETLVTNLRLSLHISNDEHLMEIRNLISNATTIPIR